MLLNYSNVFGHLHTREFLSSKWYFEVKIQKILREISSFYKAHFACNTPKSAIPISQQTSNCSSFWSLVLDFIGSL